MKIVWRFFETLGREHILKAVLKKDSRCEIRNDYGFRVVNAATLEVRQEPGVPTPKHS